MNQANFTCLQVHRADSGRLGLVRALVSARFESSEVSGGHALLDFNFAASSVEAEGLVSALSKLGDLAFEVSCFDSADARRWVFTPQLGLGSVAIDQAGNQLIGENQLLELVRKSALNGIKMERLIRQALLAPWDDQFEHEREQRLGSELEDRRVG